MRRLRHKPMDVCQNCKYGNNMMGIWKQTWKRKDFDGDGYGYWHIYCEVKEKYYPWDYKKRCIERRIVR